jgi:hypothetical protein
MLDKRYRAFVCVLRIEDGARRPFRQYAAKACVWAIPIKLLDLQKSAPNNLEELKSDVMPTKTIV